MILPNVNSPHIQRMIDNPRFQQYINRPLRIVSNKDVPYLAGYNKAGNTVYFDRHFNPFMSYKGKTIDTRKFIKFHEIGEKALMFIYGLKYQQAHHIITHFELLLVRLAGIDTRVYSRFLNPQIKGIHHEQLKKVPKDLDLEPYKDENERSILRSLQQGKDIRTLTRKHSFYKRRH